MKTWWAARKAAKRVLNDRLAAADQGSRLDKMDWVRS